MSESECSNCSRGMSNLSRVLDPLIKRQDNIGFISLLISIRCQFHDNIEWCYNYLGYSIHSLYSYIYSYMQLYAPIYSYCTIIYTVICTIVQLLYSYIYSYMHQYITIVQLSMQLYAHKKRLKVSEGNTRALHLGCSEIRP